MGLKLDLTKTEYDALPESVKALYVLTGDKAALDIEGREDTSGLKSALQKEREAAAALRKQVAEREAAENAAREAALAEQGNYKELLAQNQKRVEAAEAQVKAAQEKAARALVSARTSQLAAALTADPKRQNLLLPHLQQYVHADVETGAVVFKGLDGTPLDEAGLLAKARIEYAPVVDGAAGAGGGAAGARPTGGAGATITRTQLAALSPHEQMVVMRTNPKIVD